MKLFAALVSLLVVVACTQNKSVPSIKTVRQTGIINGQPVFSKDPIAKHVVAITDSLWENCSGTLIAKNLVLTAAHCETPGQMMYVAFGTEVSEHNIDKVHRLEVVDYRLIPGRHLINPETDELNQKDLMIVKFEGELPEGYAPAELLTDESVLENGTIVIAAGYGVTDGVEQTGDGFLNQTRMPIYDKDFSETEIMTDETQSGTCNIDSGGPVFVNVEDKLLLWGVTSRGSENCDGFGVYTKVTSFNKWITDMMKELGED